MTTGWLLKKENPGKLPEIKLNVPKHPPALALDVLAGYRITDFPLGLRIARDFISVLAFGFCI